MIQNKKIGVAVPCYRVEGQIQRVLRSIPDYVDSITAVLDASPDRSIDEIHQAMKDDARIRLIEHQKNTGVGGAVKSGFDALMEDGCEILVKLDGDGQMDPVHIPRLISPLISEKADYAKGNRFGHREHFRSMPLIRKFGNIVLTFLTKLSSGYWKNFDPQNGYLAVTAKMYRQFDPKWIESSYFFENSMLIALNIFNGVCADVNLPAIYGNEQSSLKISRILLEFPPKLFFGFFRRLFYKYLVYDFSPVILLFGVGSILFGSGSVYGAHKWLYYNLVQGTGAPTGSIMIVLLLLLSGFELILQGLIMDIQNSEKLYLSVRD